MTPKDQEALDDLIRRIARDERPLPGISGIGQVLAMKILELEKELRDALVLRRI